MFSSYARNATEIEKRPKTAESTESAANFGHLKERVQLVKSVNEKEQDVTWSAVPCDLPRRKKTKNIPKIIHFIWLGRMPERYVNNLSQISSRFPTHQACLWTDSGNMAHHSTLLDHYQLGDRIKVKNLEKHIENAALSGSASLSGSSWQKAHGAFCREHEGTYKNYAAASDIARLMVLYKYGGQYFDVDVLLNITNGVEHIRNTRNRKLTIRPNASNIDYRPPDSLWTNLKKDGEKLFPHKEALTTTNGALALTNHRCKAIDIGQDWRFRTFDKCNIEKRTSIYANSWLASLSQSGFMTDCLRTIGRYYERPPQDYSELSYAHPTRREYSNTWKTKRTHNKSRPEGTVVLTGPVFLTQRSRIVETLDITKGPEKQTKVEGFIVTHAELKDDDPKETWWRKVDTKNSRASESPF